MSSVGDTAFLSFSVVITPRVILSLDGTPVLSKGKMVRRSACDWLLSLVSIVFENEFGVLSSASPLTSPEARDDVRWAFVF